MKDTTLYRFAFVVLLLAAYMIVVLVQSRDALREIADQSAQSCSVPVE